ncbi:3-keto-disaccharide hydrolase [Rubellimicrobium roseum]|uniref:DUF1080 domain-containing protein n=1 Tax=Rubellimicrobium roseum TaxID=687525 RepID=A0A5C4NB83_9RHOB|nr:DUF1080 domain-containing protein [Rubellimicrobium roseum]TNC64193.1 DUF1080 domain-containing protein [Rubellimicrobium roseum]
MSGDVIRLFDGETLKGWHAVPRVIVPRWPRDPMRQLDATTTDRILRHTGRWTVEDGAICGRQDPPGSGLGAYLVSDETFGDFELLFEAKPDWPADTGIMLRASALGAQGYQVLLDHRKSGNIGGFYGNGIGGFHAINFTLDAERDAAGRVTGLRVEDPATTLEPISDLKRALLTQAASGEAFLSAWRWDDWNEFRITVRGTLPTITTIVNGLRVAELDAARLPSEVFDAEGALGLLGRRGHIAFEVHDNDPGMGDARWASEAVCRWRNVRIRPL